MDTAITVFPISRRKLLALVKIKISFKTAKALVSLHDEFRIKLPSP